MKKCCLLLSLVPFYSHTFLVSASYPVSSPTKSTANGTEQSSVSEEGSIFQELFRSYDDQKDDTQKSLTVNQRLAYGKKGLLGLMILSVSLGTAATLSYNSYNVLYKNQPKTAELHDAYELAGKEKTGPEWEARYWEAIKEQRMHDLLALGCILMSGGIVYYNWKQRIAQRTLGFFRKMAA